MEKIVMLATDIIFKTFDDFPQWNASKSVHFQVVPVQDINNSNNSNKSFSIVLKRPIWIFQAVKLLYKNCPPKLFC